MSLIDKKRAAYDYCKYLYQLGKFAYCDIDRYALEASSTAAEFRAIYAYLRRVCARHL